jgi:hypothetical protein
VRHAKAADLPSQQVTIAMAMCAVAMVAIPIRATQSGNSDLFGMCLLLAELLLPCCFIPRLGFPKSSFEILAIVMGMAYLAWGAVFAFRPCSPDPAADPWSSVSQRMCHFVLVHVYFPAEFHPHLDVDVRRWNWGLLAILYAVLFVEALSLLPRPGQLRTSTRGAAGAGRTEISRRWILQLGPFAAGTVTLLLGLASGLSLGLLVSWWRAAALWSLVPELWRRWSAVIGSILFLAVTISLRFTCWKSRRRKQLLALALAVYWAFSLSVQLDDPRPKGRAGPNIIIRRPNIPGRLPFSPAAGPSRGSRTYGPRTGPRVQGSKDRRFKGTRTGDTQGQTGDTQGQAMLPSGAQGQYTRTQGHKDRQCLPAERGPAAARTWVWKIA